MIWKYTGSMINCSSNCNKINGFKCPDNCGGQCDVCLIPFKSNISNTESNSENNIYKNKVEVL